MRSTASRLEIIGAIVRETTTVAGCLHLSGGGLSIVAIYQRRFVDALTCEEGFKESGLRGSKGRDWMFDRGLDLESLPEKGS